MQQDTANGPEDIIDAEILKELLIETIYEITKGFQRTGNSPSS